MKKNIILLLIGTLIGISIGIAYGYLFPYSVKTIVQIEEKIEEKKVFPGTKIESCYNETINSCNDNYILQDSKKNKSIDSCNDIKTDYIKNICINEILLSKIFENVTPTLSIKECDVFEDSNYKKQCIEDINLKFYDKLECSKITKLTLKSKCNILLKKENNYKKQNIINLKDDNIPTSSSSSSSS